LIQKYLKKRIWRILFNSILFNERIMITIICEDNFVSRAAGELRNSPEGVIPIIRESNTILSKRLLKNKWILVRYPMKE
jgi:hypothetical protein